MSSFVKKKQTNKQKKKTLCSTEKVLHFWYIQFWSEMKFYLSQCNIQEQYIMTDGTLSVLKPI